MSQHRKHRGMESQRVVAEYLRQWWPYAEPAGAGRSGTAVLGLIGIDVEVKARRDLDPTGTLRQQMNRAKEGVIPVAVIRPDGYGPARIDEWPAVMPLSVLARLLKEAGYA